MGIGLLTPAAFADPPGRPQHRPAGINKREHRQVERIKHGVKQDEITKAEADRLKADQAAIWTSREIKRATHNDKAPGGH
jgi:hypothetical protein